MKKILLLIFLFVSAACSAQKYVLVDEKMATPVTYADKVTVKDDYKELFAIEKKTLQQFLKEVEKIAAILSDKKKPKPETMDFTVGVTHFHGLKVVVSGEQRMDIVLVSDCGDIKTSMHLSDEKSSNSSNVFYINTWLKYIKSYLK